VRGEAALRSPPIISWCCVDLIQWKTSPIRAKVAVKRSNPSHYSDRSRCQGVAGQHACRDDGCWLGGFPMKNASSIFRPQFPSPRHPFHQLMPHRSITKPIQINVLNLVGKIGQPSSFGENPPIRREKARPFRPCTIKVSGEKPANTREFPSPRRAESMFS
jgi:hypothetical protein